MSAAENCVALEGDREIARIKRVKEERPNMVVDCARELAPGSRVRAKKRLS